jgi:hypothetical protein
MAGRFFRATARAGNLHLLDFQDWEPWEATRVQYRNKAEVEWLVRLLGDAHRVIFSIADLDNVITESAEPRAVSLYVSEDLLDEVLRRWEAMKQTRHH